MTTWKRAALAVAATALATGGILAAGTTTAAATVASTPLSATAGTMHTDDPCYGSLQGSYYCSPGAGMNSLSPDQSMPAYTPVQPPFGYNNLPQCSGGALAGVIGALNGEGC